MNPKTFSDCFFEAYLETHRLKYEYEKSWEGIEKLPDYTIDYSNEVVIFDVKEFDFLPTHPGFFAYDPYRRIREKINQAYREFKPFKNYPCGLVLYSTDPLVDIWNRDFMLGAMYGDITLKVPFGRGSEDLEPELAFHRRGKMFHFDRQEPQNTTIRAVISLCRFDFEMVVRANHLLSDEERAKMMILKRNGDKPYFPGVIVWHNHFARIPLPYGLFTGVFDRHFGTINGQTRQIYAGFAISALERASEG